MTITLNGRPMNDTVEWQPGFQEGRADLLAGPAFVRYYGEIRIDAGFPPRMHIYAFIDDVLCGDSDLGISGHVLDYLMIVDPEELRPGGGRDGAEINLILTVEGQPDIDLGRQRWQPGPAIELPTFDRTGQIRTKPVPH